MQTLLPRTILLSAVLAAGFSTPTADIAAQEPAQPPPPPPETAQPAPPVRADLGEANELVRGKKYAEAEALLAGLEAEFPDDPDLLTLRGELLLALRRPEDAAEVLGRAAGLDPLRPRLQFQLASALAATGKGDLALQAFARETQNNDDPQVLVLAHLNRSMLFQERGKTDLAAEELEAVLALEPSRAPVYGDLVALYVEAGRTEDAIAALRRGDPAGFRSAPHWYSVAARVAKDGDFSLAIDLLQKTLEIDPGYADAERSLAAALDQVGRGDEAVDHLRRYLELRPDSPDAAAVRLRIEAGARN